MKIAIIGSQGLIGKSIKKNLIKKFNVISVDRENSKNLKSYIRQDLSKKINIDKFVGKEAKVAVLLAFYKSQPKDFSNTNNKIFFNQNNKILKNSLKICKILKVKKLIYFSSPAVYQLNYRNIKISENFKKKPKNVYGKFKLFAETKILKFGIENNIIAINLRLFNYFNDRGNILTENFKRQILKKNVVISGNGLQKRDFLHIDDITQSIISISKRNINSGNYNLCSSIGVSIKSILKKCLGKNSHKIKIKYQNKSSKADHLVGNNKKLKKFLNFRITKKFSNFILR